jgi:hypothetical protein
MKSIVPIIIFVFILSGFQSCNMVCKKGRGNIKTETRIISEFNQLEIKGQPEVILEQSVNPSIRVSIDSNLIEYVKTEISGSKLKIFESRCLKEISDYKIYISTNTLKTILINGSAKLKCDSLFRTDKLTINSEDAGSISFNADIEDLEVNVEGSGSVKLKGRTNNFKIDMESAGSIEAIELLSKNVDFNVSGAGTVEVNVSENLNGEASGSGKLFYKGNPRIVKTNNKGTGTIQTKVQ